MILAYDSIDDCLRFEILSSDGKILYKKNIASDPVHKIPRFDLLLQLTTFLEENKLLPNNIEKIIFVCGSGRFTAVRTACIVANAFAQNTNARLIPITKEQLTQAKEDFAEFCQQTPLAANTLAEPLFASEPRIHGKN